MLCRCSTRKCCTDRSGSCPCEFLVGPLWSGTLTRQSTRTRAGRRRWCIRCSQTCCRCSRATHSLRSSHLRSEASLYTVWLSLVSMQRPSSVRRAEWSTSSRIWERESHLRLSFLEWGCLRRHESCVAHPMKCLIAQTSLHRSSSHRRSLGRFLCRVVLSLPHWQWSIDARLMMRHEKKKDQLYGLSPCCSVFTNQRLKFSEHS